jgi:hypothetical protein
MSTSIHVLSPLELGGVHARTGLSFQDHVAAAFLLRMLTDDRLSEVWCETQDDVTLIWEREEGQVVEFVQVKSAELGHLWSVAELCRRENGRAGTSLLERSLAYDRAEERATFRIVTTRDVSKDLAVLKNPCDSPARHGDALNSLHKKIGALLTARSPNGNDALYWLQNSLWEVRHTEDAVRSTNVLGLAAAVHKTDQFLAPDQVDELYARLVKIAYDAALAKWSLAPQTKRLRRADFTPHVQQLVFNATHPKAQRNKLRRKLEAAQLSGTTVEGAERHRLAYRSERLRPKYVTTTADADLLDLEVDAVLLRLRSQLEAGQHPDGAAFHSDCVEELEWMREKTSPTVPRFYVQGCMYDMTDRCLHRFIKDGE